MPIYCRCHVKGCTFDKNHGFTDDVGGMTRYYHDTPDGGTHYWWGVQIEPVQRAKVKVGTVREYGGKLFLETPSRSEAFELGVVTDRTRPGDGYWVDAWRARIAGDEPLAARLFRQWKAANELPSERAARLARQAAKAAKRHLFGR